MRPSPPAAASPDQETRRRLVHAAAELFADRGFDDVTVREICAAAPANLAAVNYHFRDKAGLYRAVVDAAIAVMQETSEQAQTAGAGAAPDERIRAFTRTFVARATSASPHGWIHRLMTRETEHPSDVFQLVVRRVIAPRTAYLADAAAALMRLPADHPAVVRSVFCLQGLCYTLIRQRRLPPGSAGLVAVGDPAAMAEHIADFSIAAMRALARGSGRERRRAGEPRRRRVKAGKSSAAATS